VNLHQPAATSPEDLIAWLQEPVSDPLPASVAHNCYLLMHPRIAYLKNVRRNGVILDVGRETVACTVSGTG
jgi:hypothetical protein